jgi:hypothetical protein
VPDLALASLLPCRTVLIPEAVASANTSILDFLALFGFTTLLEFEARRSQTLQCK